MKEIVLLDRCLKLIEEKKGLKLPGSIGVEQAARPGDGWFGYAGSAGLQEWLKLI
jgi:hypothetical protein